jgi:5-methylcytosine-specific restriction endonuclease McrA
MLRRLLQYLFSDQLEGRSPKWSAERAAWLKENPQCAACGETGDVSVHHKMPVGHDHSRELDKTNYITLCERYGHHFVLGHGKDWKARNDNVVADCQRIREIIETRRYK